MYFSMTKYVTESLIFSFLVFDFRSYDQFGIPPETIKDSMQMGLPVAQIYIVPIERFCREMGPALGVNLAEFEFPAYFNFFVYKKRCTLVVDSIDAEENIRRVFGETLLGPAQFRRAENPIQYEDEDFAPDFPREAIPNFQKEFHHFRIMPDGKELMIETLLNFCHFENQSEGHQENLGIPPPLVNNSSGEQAATNTLTDEQVPPLVGSQYDDEEECETASTPVANEADAGKSPEDKSTWTYSHARFMGTTMLFVIYVGWGVRAIFLPFFLIFFLICG
jgi:hypothetical protein